MIRNFKALGFVLAALLSMSGIAASAASAQQGKFTAEEPVTLDITGIAGGIQEGITTFGGRTECPGTIYTGHQYNITPHALIPGGATAITVTPHFINCKAEVAGASRKATITMNGCDYVFHIGQTVAADKYAITADIVCPLGKAIEMHAYLSATVEDMSICKFTIKPQSSLEGVTATTSTEADDVSIEGTFKGIHVERQGLCGAATSTVGEFHMHLTFQGEDKFGQSKGITITD